MLEKVLSLPIEKKIGQLFFIGLPGSDIDEATKKLLEDVSPGGICLFSRNIKNVTQTCILLDSIREVSEIEPFLSIDQEGGLVDRLRRISMPMPSASLIKTTEDAASLAETTAKILRMLGFNMNFAPVVDVVSEEQSNSSNGLYSRAFGNSKEEVLNLAGIYLEKLQDNGCLGCLKHFPGLGASEIDSHEDLPLVRILTEQLFNNDLFPYKNLFQTSKVKAVMVAHAAYPNTDLQEIDSNGKLLPSSLSLNFVTRLLRRELGFEELVITDDLEMGAIIKNYSIGKACLLALCAGEDMLSICADQEAIREGFFAVLDAVRRNEISETRIDESLKRIQKVKSLMHPPIPFNTEYFNQLSETVAQLNNKLNYKYGG